jgi:hypothetical protein
MANNEQWRVRGSAYAQGYGVIRVAAATEKLKI